MELITLTCVLTSVLLLINTHVVRSVSNYKYYEDDEVVLGSTVNRSFVTVLLNPLADYICPQGYFISEINYVLLNDVTRKKSDLMTLQLPTSLTDEHRIVSKDLCGTLAYCLGYAGCVFKFSTEFCRNIHQQFQV